MRLQALQDQKKLVDLLEISTNEMKKTLDVTQEALVLEAKQKDTLVEKLLLAVRCAR